MSDHKYNHFIRSPNTRLRQGQGGLAIERYHYLCAAIQQKYEIVSVPADISKAQLFPRQGLIFTKYNAFNLEPVLGIKLHPGSDGTIHPGDIDIYRKEMRNGWKCSQGGILYSVGCARAFWNMIIDYHSSSATTGMKVWDKLFVQLKASGFEQSLVPCMFFATSVGCHTPTCPFLHNKKKAQKARDRILARRRVRLGKPTSRDIGAREKIAIQAYHDAQDKDVDYDSALTATIIDDDDDEELDPELQEIFEESAKIKKICNNPACLTVKMKRGAEGNNATAVKMDVCSRCKVGTYCSKECQKADWKRHKTEPCRPFEELVEDDDLWDDFGYRKGTGRFKIVGE
ncbi:hypothetical protein BDW22DRAFT_1398698 [Trametopsis cervina]|nr:hypothetical protein BDW22DRAFT_1398698 [Trametopsis cervina]